MKRYGAALLAALCTAFFFAGTVQSQTPGTIKITGPANNSTVNGPVALNVDIGGVTVKPAAEGDPAAFHYHALVDVDPATVVVPGQPLPTGQANIIHTADKTLMLPNLAPGPHSVVVILTRTDHVPLSPTVQDRVSFTVGQAAAAPAAGAQAPPAGQGAAAAPRVGTGGGVDADAVPSLPLLLALGAMLVVVSGGFAVRARRR